METTSLTMTTTSTAGKKSTKSITDVNPNASEGEMYQLATALNNVTTNTLTGVSRVDKTELTNVTYNNWTIEYSGSHSALSWNAAAKTLTVDLSECEDSTDTETNNSQGTFNFSFNNVKVKRIPKYIVETPATEDPTINTVIFDNWQANEWSMLRFVFTKEPATINDTAKVILPAGEYELMNDSTAYFNELAITINYI